MIAISCSRGFSPTQGMNPHLLHCRQILYHWAAREVPCLVSCIRVKLLLSYLTLCNPMDFSLQAPLFIWVCKQEYWSGLPCPPPGDLPKSGTGPASFMPPALAGGFLTTSAEEDKLKFHITAFSFCLCNSACPLQSPDHVGHMVSESGGLQY